MSSEAKLFKKLDEIIRVLEEIRDKLSAERCEHVKNCSERMVQDGLTSMRDELSAMYDSIRKGF